MEHSVVNTIKRYLRIYGHFWRFSVILATMYHISFFIEIAVTLGYQFIFILFFNVLFQNVESIAGWSYNEILFFIGMTIVVHAILESTFMINMHDLPGKIKNGDLDYIILKPVHSLFTTTLMRPFFTILISMISGIAIILYALVEIHRVIPINNIIVGMLLIIPGVIIAYSFVVIISSLSFMFINAQLLPYIADNIIYRFDNNPHTVYTGFLKKLFFYFIPVVFINSIPASAVVHGIEMQYVYTSFVLAGISITLTVFIWNIMIRHYTSASS